MATAEQYADWIVKNADKKGTPEFETVAKAYQLAKSQTSKLEPLTADPTDGMSAFERGAAGAGKAVVDLGRGLGQMIGLVDRKDVAESRKRDAALMNTTAGTVGNVAGNLALLAPTAFIPGAATLPGAAVIGAATGLVQPSTSTTETAKNTAIGGVAAPAAILAGRGIAAGYQGGKSAVDAFTKSGQNRIAAETLRASATNPAQAMQNLRNAKPLVPGSQPTVGQVAQDPGLAQLERTMLNNPDMAAPLQQRLIAQRAARSEALRGVAGTDDYYDAIKDGRRIFANEDYAKAIEQGVDPQMAKAMAPQLQNLLERPSIQRAQKDAIRLAKESGVALNESPAGSLQGLDWVKKALDNRISMASQPGSSIGKEELKALLQTKNDLMATMEQIAPAYKQANDAYAAMSRQVNGMDVARSLESTLQRPGSEYAVGGSAKEMGDAFMRALSQAQESVKKSTGMNKTINDVMPTSDIALLENIARDIGRKQFAETAGRATGSNTAQNLVSQNMLRRMIGPLGMPESWAENTMLQTLFRPVQFAGKLAEPRIQNRLAEMMLNPEQAAQVMAMTQALPITSRLGVAAQPYLPQLALNPLAAATANRPQ